MCGGLTPQGYEVASEAYFDYCSFINKSPMLVMTSVKILIISTNYMYTYMYTYMHMYMYSR